MSSFGVYNDPVLCRHLRIPVNSTRATCTKLFDSQHAKNVSLISSNSFNPFLSSPFITSFAHFRDTFLWFAQFLLAATFLSGLFLHSLRKRKRERGLRDTWRSATEDSKTHRHVSRDVMRPGELNFQLEKSLLAGTSVTPNGINNHMAPWLSKANQAVKNLFPRSKRTTAPTLSSRSVYSAR